MKRFAHGGKRKGAGRPKGQGKYGEETKPIRIPKSMVGSVLKFIDRKKNLIPFYSAKVAAGSPSLTDDTSEEQIDLNEYLVKNPSATFLVRATGESMMNANIHENDILVIDRSIQATNGKIVIAAIDGQLTVKRLSIKGNTIFLLPENENFDPIKLTENNEVYILGVVTNVIHQIF